MNYANEAAHVFKISEATGRTVFDLIWETMADYPQLEINRMAAVMTDQEIKMIADRFTSNECAEMDRRAAMWNNTIEVTQC